MQRKIVVFLVLLACFSIVFSSISLYLLSPRPSQPFMGFGVQSQENLPAGFIPGSNTTISLNRTVTWTLHVTNMMGAIQYVEVAYKIGNSTTIDPNVSSSAPSTVPVLGIEDAFIANDRTGNLTFTWSVISETQKGQLIFVNMIINGQDVTVAVGAVLGLNFKFIFELWTFDPSSNSFQYGWGSGSSRTGSWLQVWFNVAH